MDVFEYNEVRWPTRALQQEEEEQAIPGADGLLLQPEVKWHQDHAQHLRPHLLVVGLTPASCVLLEGALGPEAKVVGEVVAHTGASSSATSGHNAPMRAALYAPSQGVLLCCCTPAVAPEQAPAWARGLLRQLQPQRVLLLGSMQAEQYRGEADASQELLAFVLRSTHAREQQQEAAATKPVVPYLPSGSIVSGLPAAVLSQAELAGLQAELYVVVEQVPSLVPETLLQLAQLVAASVQAALAAGGQPGIAQQWVCGITHSSNVDAARCKLHKTSYRPSSVYS